MRWRGVAAIRRAGQGFCAAGWLVLSLAGCATYDALPLDTASHLKHRLADLDHAGVDIRRPLTVDDVTRLAVVNNPDLIAARFQRGVAQAQVLLAGILPNPSISASYLWLIPSGAATAAGAFADAVGASLVQDVQKSIAVIEKVRQAKSDALQVDASLLWQEWQLIGKARLLVVDLIEGAKQKQVLVENRDLLMERFDRGNRAMAEGNATIATVSPDLAAVSDIHKQLDDLDRDQTSKRHDLNALLGLAPEVPLPLISDLKVPKLDPKFVRSLLPGLPNRRPDLIALQLGYRSQEAKVRGAIVGQFPALTIGPSYSSDTSNVVSIGPQITMDLPIFDRNQGNIAVETATREQLHAEFTARIAAANGEVRATLADQQLIVKQIAEQKDELDLVTKFASQAERALRERNLEERAYVDLVTASYTKQIAILNLEQLLIEEQVSIATLIGAGMPQATLPPDKCSGAANVNWVSNWTSHCDDD
jgi:outer membrane protein TolC